MAIRETTYRECLDLGVGLMVYCDRCGWTMDHLGKKGTRWRDQYERGELYAGELLCHRCVENDRLSQKGE